MPQQNDHVLDSHMCRSNDVLDGLICRRKMKHNSFANSIQAFLVRTWDGGVPPDWTAGGQFRQKSDISAEVWYFGRSSRRAWVSVTGSFAERKWTRRLSATGSFAERKWTSRLSVTGSFTKRKWTRRLPVTGSFAEKKWAFRFSRQDRMVEIKHG